MPIPAPLINLAGKATGLVKDKILPGAKRVGKFIWEAPAEQAAKEVAGDVAKEVAEETAKNPGFIRRGIGHIGSGFRRVGEGISNLGSRAYQKLPEGFRGKVTTVGNALGKANDWRLGQHLTVGNALDAAMNGMVLGSELAEGNTVGGAIGSTLGFMGGWRAGDNMVRKLLKNRSGPVRFIGGTLGGLGLGIGAQMAGSRIGQAIGPSKRFATPIEEHNFAPDQELEKGAEEYSMNKFAMLKEAEVAGVLKAFTDAGLMQKFAEEDFSYLTEKVAENLGDSYTVDDVAYVADALLSGGVEKTAEDVFFDEAAPILGNAYMAKLAGEIDDDDLAEFTNAFFEGAGF